MQVLRRRLVGSLLLPDSRLMRFAPPAVWALLLFVLSSIPGDRYPDVRIVQFDKLVHFLMYMPLGITLSRAFAPPASSGAVTTHGQVLRVTALGALYGATDELHQYFVPNRSSSLLDWVVDLAAVWTGAVCWRLIEKRWKAAAEIIPGERA